MLFGGMTAPQLIFWVIAVFALVGFLVKMWPAFKNTVEVVDALRQLPSLVTGMATTTTALEKLNTQIAEIHHEVHFNNGSSVKDATKRIEDGVAGIYKRIDGLDVAVAELRDADDALAAQIEETKENPNV